MTPALEFAFELLDGAKLVLPLPLEGPRNQAVLGLDGIVLASGALSLVALRELRAAIRLTRERLEAAYAYPACRR